MNEKCLCTCTILLEVFFVLFAAPSCFIFVIIVLIYKDVNHHRYNELFATTLIYESIGYFKLRSVVCSKVFNNRMWHRGMRRF